ncbi:MAG TPA: hypothetical protein VJA21_29535, partial [Verrucomicrobiae bacterium]
FSGVSVLYNAFVAVLNGLVIALRHVNPGILIGCLAVFALAWALFVGLGTACVKLALARRTGIGAVSDLFSGTVEPTGVSVLRRAND